MPPALEPGDAEVLETAADRCGHWYPELVGPVVPTVTSIRRRLTTRLIFLTCKAGDGATREVVAKIPVRHTAPGVDRPRRVPATSSDAKHQLEAVTLRAAAEQFDRRGDDRLGVVRLLDSDPVRGTLFLERVRARTARELFWRQWWRHASGAAPMLDTVADIGVWLRCYHASPGLRHTITRHTTWEEALGSAVALAASLDGGMGETTQQCLAAARGTLSRLPDDLPLGLLHGDAAMRNFFATAEGRVLGYDLLGRWYGPCYEDLAFFLVDLRAGGPQAPTFGRATPEHVIDQYENMFLDAYFGDEEVPRTAVGVYELIMLVDRWVAARWRSRSALRRSLVDRFFVGLARQWLGRYR